MIVILAVLIGFFIVYVRPGFAAESNPTGVGAQHEDRVTLFYNANDGTGNYKKFYIPTDADEFSLQGELYNHRELSLIGWSIDEEHDIVNPGSFYSLNDTYKITSDDKEKGAIHFYGVWGDELDPVASITDSKTPLASMSTTTLEGPYSSTGAESWSLINLLLTIGTGLIMLMMIFTFTRRRRVNPEEDEDYYGKEYAREDEYSARHRRYVILRLLTAAATFASVALFIITQDLALPMALTDDWTASHIIIAILALALATLNRLRFAADDNFYNEGL